MTVVYLADAQPEERSALRLLLMDLNMEVVGEAADWPTTLAKALAWSTHSFPQTQPVWLAELR
jgi:DNA-binding NarL/FixJ family response regulator